MTTAIIGGGLTGVTLARLLALQGEEVVILERDETYGGLCRSHTEDGFTFDDGGSHIIFSRDTAVQAFMRDVLQDNKAERNRNTKIFFKGAYVKYPFENGLAELPPEDRFYCINEYIKTLIALEKGELPSPENFREWILYTFGTGIANLYMIPYNEKIWNYPAEKMSLHWVDGRIPRPPVEDIIKSAIGIETEGYTHQSVFTYPVTGGIEALVRAIAAPVENKIRCGFSVSSIRKTADGFLISNGTETIMADRCISTIPPQELLPCLSDVPPEVSGAVFALCYNSLFSVCIGVSHKVNDYSWLYVPQKELGLFNRISFPSNYSDAVAPAGQSSVLAEITFNEGDAVSRMTDEEIIAHTMKGLAEMEILESPDDVVYSAVRRQDYAYVVYDLAYQKNIGTVLSYLKRIGIEPLGRFGEFEYLNMDGCIRRVLDYLDLTNPA